MQDDNLTVINAKQFEESKKDIDISFDKKSSDGQSNQEQEEDQPRRLKRRNKTRDSLQQQINEEEEMELEEIKEDLAVLDESDKDMSDDEFMAQESSSFTDSEDAINATQN